MKKTNIFEFSSKLESTKKVVDFYNEFPFPNYDDLYNKLDLHKKLKNNLFLKIIEEYCGFGKKVLEVGSGTSQLSNLLASVSNNQVTALDATYNSLLLGSNFSNENNINNVIYANLDIDDSDKILKDNYFDVIICSGVLHHTENPKKNFNKIVKLLKEDGVIVLGLYNKYGRIRSYLIKFMYAIFGKKILNFIDNVYKNKKIDQKVKNSWVQDQYNHPLESAHSLFEALEWFDKNSINVLEIVPDFNLDLRKKDKFNEKLKSIYYQFKINFNNYGADGGLFLLIGKLKK